jgi:hypothetical protein
MDAITGRAVLKGHVSGGTLGESFVKKTALVARAPDRHA